MSSEALSLPPVLAPKLHLPRLRPSIVQREAIQARLDAASFVQSSITVKKGDSITLVADTLTPHTIANGTWGNDTAKPSTEAGAPAVKNLQVSGNSSTSIGPFTTAGTFHLYCTIHGGMQLEVIVK